MDKHDEMTGKETKARVCLMVKNSDPDAFFDQIREKREEVLTEEERKEIRKTAGLPVESEFLPKGAIITPPYDKLALYLMSDYSTILGQCVESYKTNIAGFGYNYKFAYDYDTARRKKRKKADASDAEVSKFYQFFDHCNPDMSFCELLKKIIDDREKTGEGYAEVLRGTDGAIIGFHYLPSWTMWICAPSDPQSSIETYVDENGEKRTIAWQKRFYTYVQISGGRVVYFKELGDLRKINAVTGQEIKPVQDGIAANTDYTEATELIRFSIARADTPYGVPRWLGTSINIMGSRKADEVNYTYFDNGRMVSMAILVSGGQLTSDSFTALDNAKGSAQAYKWLLLESTGSDTFSEKSQTKIDLRPLSEIIQQDALFQNYDAKNRDKVRSAFRIPPIYTGESQDYTRATAATAQSIAESQVFEPERLAIADFFNRKILPMLNITGIKIKLMGPPIIDQKELADTLKVFSDIGALTPNLGRKALEELLGTTLDNYENWFGDIPALLAYAMIMKASEGQSPGDLAKALVDVRKELEKTLAKRE